MNHKQITITFTDGDQKTLVIDAVNGVRYEGDGEHEPVVAKFGRTDSTRWQELLAAPLCKIKHWG
jgi:hypothetical protein